MSSYPTILSHLRVGPHPLPAVTIRGYRGRWQKIPLGSPRPSNSPKAERRRGWRYPRIGQRSRTWVTRIHPSRCTTSLARRGQNYRYRGRTHEGTNGAHCEEEAEKGLQKDHPAQADLYPPADWSIRVSTPTTTDTFAVVYYGHRMERHQSHIIFFPSGLSSPFLANHIHISLSASCEQPRKRTGPRVIDSSCLALPSTFNFRRQPTNKIVA